MWYQLSVFVMVQLALLAALTIEFNLRKKRRDKSAKKHQ